MQNLSSLDCTHAFRFERKPNHCSGFCPFYYVIIHRRVHWKCICVHFLNICNIFIAFVCLFLTEMWSTCSCTKKNTWRKLSVCIVSMPVVWCRTPKVSDFKPAMVFSSTAHSLWASHLSSKCHVNYYFGAVGKWLDFTNIICLTGSRQGKVHFTLSRASKKSETGKTSAIISLHISV